MTATGDDRGRALFMERIVANSKTPSERRWNEAWRDDPDLIASAPSSLRGGMPTWWHKMHEIHALTTGDLDEYLTASLLEHNHAQAEAFRAGVAPILRQHLAALVATDPDELAADLVGEDRTFGVIGTVKVSRWKCAELLTLCDLLAKLRRIDPLTERFGDDHAARRAWIDEQRDAWLDRMRDRHRGFNLAAG